ncbi:MAG: ABC transporter ATP-binding protein [Kiritimatiellia bacterium]|jgi:lipoprotein-releasing system ATP-binding protein|nr:ABC transporter ATP-binding protein [Kiritimatiellia bacterium]MDP6849247.1 ABC transporter ATP-binding protein [Kiritimatiellia bacterium]
MSSLIKADNIHKTYVLPASTVKVLGGASLEVREGESLAIVGVSGAGKSTLLHCLGALDRPDSGQVYISGEDVYGASGNRRAQIRSAQLGFVFQSYHLLPEMDVLENVMLPAMAVKGFVLNRNKARERALELLSAVSLLPRATHTPMELSGGEQQRVALARALMNDPAIVLADEPTGNLDESTGAQVLGHLFALTRDRDHALVIVTHSETLAGSCDRAVRLVEGVLEPM